MGHWLSHIFFPPGRQISRAKPAKLILLGRGENSIYEIHQELIEKFGADRYIPVIADIRDAERIDSVFSQYRPQLVFHAAAHKHVPLMEIQPAEAVRNNVFGTRNVAELADRFSSEIFVLISTDKAVNPTSVMGATKRCAELVLQEINQHSSTKFVTVRFGNVLGSRGSVVQEDKTTLSPTQVESIENIGQWEFLSVSDFDILFSESHVL